MSTSSKYAPTILPSPSDRSIVLDLCGELVEMGHGILEDFPRLELADALSEVWRDREPGSNLY
jgi:hypothetical protein